jgi:DNA-binding CsgD family transcriptional regulator
MSHLFSPHQIGVLDLVSEGLKNKEIGRYLSMSESMIKNTCDLDLAGCDTRVEVVVWWRNHRGCEESTANSKRDGQSATLFCTANLGCAYDRQASLTSAPAPAPSAAC